MSIINIQLGQAGLVGVLPSVVYINTSDTIAQVTTTGYLNKEVANGAQFQLPCIAAVATQTSASAAPVVAWYQLVHSAPNWSLVGPVDGSIALPNGDIFVGNGSGIASPVPLSGDATLANTGALTIAAGAITGSKIAANVVDYANIALDVAATATVALTAAQINGMYAAPVQLLAAPGVGNLIIIDSMLWDVAFVSAQYASGGAIAAQYGNTVHGAGPAASANMAAANLIGVAASSFLGNGSGSTALDVTKTASLNTAVYLSNATGAFTTGDSTVNLYIRYRVVTPA